MLQAISWSQFVCIVLASAACYYLIVGLLFYKRKIASLLVKSPAKDNVFSIISVLEDSGIGLVEDEERSVGSPRPARGKQIEQEPDLYPIANELVETIDEFIVSAGKKGQIKEETMFGIHHLIGKYPMIKSSGFKTAINNYIVIAIKSNCGFSIEDTDLVALWAD